ncbi:hypothetical protein J5N97_001849 [Dioscorea zingiberensis]|nr:hypothetical protein J5N97_001849 [Dioscorea zingiberensis]
MSGRNAKTNFPIARTPAGDEHSQTSLSEVLSAKLRRCCKTPSPSLTCLRLDTEKSNIGVWQKRAGARAESNWVMTVQLGKLPQTTDGIETSSAQPEAPQEVVIGGGMEDEERVALQMIEELLNRNYPSSPSRQSPSFLI